MKVLKLMDYTGTIIGQWRRKTLWKAFNVIDASAEASEDGMMLSVVDCRVYVAKSMETYYALLWTRSTKRGLPIRQGSGQAVGWGYDKESHAIGCAIEDAGIVLEDNIHGSGSGAVRAALLAIAKELGAKRPVIVEAYA